MIRRIKELFEFMRKVKQLSSVFEIEEIGEDVVVKVKKNLQLKVEGEYYEYVSKNKVLKTGQLLYLNPKIESQDNTSSSKAIDDAKQDAIKGRAMLEKNQDIAKKRQNSCGGNTKD